MNRRLRCLLLPCLFVLSLPCTMLGKSFNGFFTPEFIRGEEAPFVPVSATATLIFGARISGELQLRELGSYRLEGTASGDQLEIHLLPNDAPRAGRAIGKWANSQMDLQLSFTDASGALQARGKLQLEADTEWRATPAFKVGRDLKDPSLRSWYRPGYDDSRWELVQLPDDNSFGNKHPYERLYRARFMLADLKEAVNVTVSPDPPATDAGQTSQETETVNLVFSSDDGIWIYVNGHLVGHWGGRSREGGCVNDPLKRCAEDGTVPPVLVPESFLRPGENVLAVKVHNAVCCFSYFNLLVTKVRTRLVSP
jgi:hypothetical protein